MAWADAVIQKLAAGETVSFRPTGNSMVPRITSGALVTLEPVTSPEQVSVDDIVLCRVSRTFLHRVAAQNANRFRIENMRGFVNGWTSTIYGRVTAVEP